MFEEVGEYELILRASQGENHYDYLFAVTVTFDNIEPAPEGATAYITKAVGQFTNALPAYDEGDTQEVMNEKVLAAIGNNKKGMISLGGFGGYVVVGFDHTITNVTGKRDFRVLGNAFYSAANPDSDAPEGGSCEPGVIMVAYDKNQNGMPDEDEWYEIAGSAHEDAALELWYDKAVAAGNDVETYRNYEITYYRYKVKNTFHNQCYFPEWIKEDKITFKGTCLPQNAVDESGQGNYFVLYKFRYGYADNEVNTKDESAIDIDWAVNSEGTFAGN